ncbi:MAG: DUF2147 domain-containing protein [Burkholderiaceae bacterium]
MIALSSAAWAQTSPVGKWHTIDEKTREIKSEITITEAGGVLTGKISKLLRKDAKPDAVCEECSDSRKDKPMLGLEIIRGARKAEGREVWEEGKILDPENGREYALRLTPIEGGKKLEVRGSIAFIGRTQTWSRVQ